MIELQLKNFIAGGRLSLTNAFIKSVAEKMLADFSPATLQAPQPTNVDGFITEYLGFLLRYEFLSNNLSILGLTNYGDSDLTLYDPANRTIKKERIDKDTVIVDKRMLEAPNNVRYSYTVAHEGGHIIFDNPAVRQQIEDSRILAMECAEEFYEAAAYHTGAFSLTKPKDEARWIEHYCDQFASCLILPEKTVRAAGIEILRKKGIRSDCIHPHTEAERKFCFEELVGGIAKIFETSKEAALYKLCDLKLIRGGRDIIERMRLKYKR